MRVFTEGHIPEPTPEEQEQIDLIGFTREDLEQLTSVAGAAKFTNQLMITFVKKLSALPLEEYLGVCEEDMNEPDNSWQMDEAISAMVDIFEEANSLRAELRRFGKEMTAKAKALEARMAAEKV